MERGGVVDFRLLDQYNVVRKFSKKMHLYGHKKTGWTFLMCMVIIYINALDYLGT